MEKEEMKKTFCFKVEATGSYCPYCEYFNIEIGESYMDYNLEKEKIEECENCNKKYIKYFNE